MRELRAGSNFESQDPAEAHFGLGAAASVDQPRDLARRQRRPSVADVAADASLVLAARAGRSRLHAARAGERVPARRRRELAHRLHRRVAPDASAAARSGRHPEPHGAVPRRRSVVTATRPRTGRACSTALCVNATDPRLPRCTPTDVATLSITSPRKTSRKQLERDVHAQLASAFGPTGELGVGTTRCAATRRRTTARRACR